MNPVRAWAHCGTRQIAYARAGNGRTLLFLTTATLNDLTGAPAQELARSFRLIRPELNELPGNEPAVCASCMLEFLDAIGARRVAVIADPQHARAVALLADADSERISHVIVLANALSASRLEPLLESLTG